MNLLYADDDPEDRELFCAVVQTIDASIKVVLAKDGEEALLLLSTQTELPDFIFLDINMPKMNGLECLRQLKSDNRLKKVPAIIYSTGIHLKEVRMSGANGVLTKANSFSKMKEGIENVLFKSGLHYLRTNVPIVF